MRASVLFSEDARTQAHRIDTWWRANRPDSPSMFEQEFGLAIALLEEAPQAGPRFTAAALPAVRRIFLEKSKHHLYYLYDPTRGVVTVLTIWSSRREYSPAL